MGAGTTAGTPARCSPPGPGRLAVRGPAEFVFQTREVPQLHPTTLLGDGYSSLRGSGRIGANMPASCSTYVLNGQREGCVAGASTVNTDPPCPTSFPHFDGTNPRLWRAKCLQYFTHFNIHKCMWVVAATMHMQGNAKVWYEAYRLRQAVGDWPEFMDAVEAHFAVRDLPPVTPTMGAAHPGVVVLPCTSISPAMPTRSDSKEDDTGVVHKLFDDMPIWDREPQADNKLHDTYEQPILEDVIQMVRPIVDDSDEILTQVGGVSLFLELAVESVDGVLTAAHIKDVVWDEQFADPVITHIEGLSFFLEEGLSSATLVLSRVSPCHGNTFTSDIIDVSAKGLVFEFFPSWQCGGFSPGSTTAKSVNLILCCSTDRPCRYWYHSVLQPILCGTSKKKPELTRDHILATEIFVLRLELLWDPGGCQVILVHSLGTLKLITSVCSVLDTVPPWRRGGFSLGARVCTCLTRAILPSEVTQWMTSSARACPIKVSLKDESVGLIVQFFLAVGSSFALVMHCSYRNALLYDSAFFQWEVAWLVRLGCHLCAISRSFYLEFDLYLSVASAHDVLPAKPPWKCGTFSPWSNNMEGTYFPFPNMPRNAFCSRYNGMHSFHFVLATWLPWSSIGFSPGQRWNGSCCNIVFITNFMPALQSGDHGLSSTLPWDHGDVVCMPIIETFHMYQQFIWDPGGCFKLLPRNTCCRISGLSNRVIC